MVNLLFNLWGHAIKFKMCKRHTQKAHACPLEVGDECEQFHRYHSRHVLDIQFVIFTYTQACTCM